jgi:hypothetical protein
MIPGWNQLRKDYADKPVVFVAVNSGNPRSAVEAYAKPNKFEWPILVDERNQTEKQFGFTISLQNIYQWILVEPGGRARPMGANDLAGIKANVDRELSGAKMLFDGVTIPEKLKPMARDLEIGLYDPAIADLAALVAKAPKDVGEAATAMYAKLQPLAEKGLEAAKALEAEDRKGAAYFEYARVASWFRKTDYEKTATAAMAVLKKEKPVQDEIAARQMLEQAKAMQASGKKADAAAARGVLAALQKKYPATDAAKEAAKLK